MSTHGALAVIRESCHNRFLRMTDAAGPPPYVRRNSHARIGSGSIWVLWSVLNLLSLLPIGDLGWWVYCFFKRVYFLFLFRSELLGSGQVPFFELLLRYFLFQWHFWLLGKKNTLSFKPGLLLHKTPPFPLDGICWDSFSWFLSFSFHFC